MLPISETDWGSVLKSFHLHNSIRDGMAANKAYSSFLVHKERKQSLEMFTAVMTSRSWELNCSIAATYFPTHQLTLGVIFNCNRRQKEFIQDLLERSPEVSNHPLLMLGLYCELQRDRAAHLAAEITTRTTNVLIDMGYLPGLTETGKTSHDIGAVNVRLRLVISQCKKAEEEIRVTKIHTEKLVKNVCSKSGASKQKIFAKATARYKCCFEQIQLELDTRMAQCRIAAEDLTYAGDRV